MTNTSTCRVGIGYDSHRLKAGSGIRLGGITIPSDCALEGHSDADVLIHALMDALLGAAGAGDIGDHFPPGDEDFAGIDSMILLRRVLNLLKSRGLRPVNLDAVVIAEKPRLGPYKQAMKRCLAEACGLPADCVNIKATTNEGMGAIGRGEGIAVQAIALLDHAG